VIRIIITHRTKDKEETRKLVQVIQLIHAEARKQPGFIRGDTLVDVSDPTQVMVLSSWQTIEDSNAWDASETLKSLIPLLEEHLIKETTAVKLNENVIWKYG
jgi:heme-degrading monooxygenase HmoA